MALAACEKPVIEDPDEKEEEGANVTLTFSTYQQSDFTRTALGSLPEPPVSSGLPACNTTRASEPLTNQCSRLTVAVFRTDGTKVKNVTQKMEDVDFGTVRMTLAAGSYHLVAIAHNGLGNATVSTPQEVKFYNNKVTDTFAFYGTLDVQQEDDVVQELELTRRVAMFRLTMTDDQLPAGLSQMKFYYTGGSSTYDATTGYGCKESRQTEYRDCYDADGEAVKVYELYTLPHSEQDVLKLTITAIGEDGSPMGEWVMTDIPVTRNKITSWAGSLLGGSSGSGSSGTVIRLDTTWDGTVNYTW